MNPIQNSVSKTDFLFLEYIFTYFTEFLDAQLEKTGRDINQRFGDFKKTALHIAAEKDLLEAAKWLINEGADLEAKDSGGDPPLHWTAAREDSVDVARLLISRGAKVDAKESSGWTPLNHAAYMNNLKVARLLIDNGADKNAKSDYGKKPIDLAESSEMIKLLVGPDQSGKPVLELSKFLK